MRILIYTDASVCMSTFVAGYGISIVKGGEVHNFGLPFKQRRFRSPVKAEIVAIIKATKLVVERGMAVPGDELLYFSDCSEAVAMFISYLKPTGAFHSKYYEMFKALTSGMIVNMYTINRRDNRLCDKLARQGLSIARENHKNSCTKQPFLGGTDNE